MYTDPTSCRTGAHVERSSQSNGGSPERDPTRTGRPRASSRFTTLRPVLLVPPRTSTVFASCASCVSIFCSFYAVRFTIAKNIPSSRTARHRPKDGAGGGAGGGYLSPPGRLQERGTAGALSNGFSRRLHYDSPEQVRV